MKRRISLILVLAAVLCCSVTAFAKDGDEINLITEADISGAIGVVPFAVAEFGGGTVGSYPEAGMLILERNSKLYVLGAEFENPTGLAVDDEGNLYVSETDTGRIIRISNQGKASEYKTGLKDPMGLCWANGKLYCAETGKNLIITWDGKTLTTVAGKCDNEDEGEYIGGWVDGKIEDVEFDHPQGVCVDKDGTVFVSDTNNHAVRMLRDGRSYPIMVNRDMDGELVNPGHLWIENGKLYVNEMLSNEVLSYDINGNDFSDVKDADWFADSVREAVLMGITTGVGDNKFDPKGTVSRAQIAVMIARIAQYRDGMLVLGGKNIFEDVPEDTWFTKEVCWAADNGICMGFDGKFSPDDDVTRQDLVTMLYRYAKKENLAPEALASLHGFKGTEEVSAYAEEAFCWAVSAGIIDGKPVAADKDKNYKADLDPRGTATRAEAVKILVSFMNKPF